MKSIEETIAEIKSRSSEDKVFVIALSGFGGCGKTTLAKHLEYVLEGSVIVSLYNFSTEHLGERSPNWESYDWARLEKEVLIPLSLGEKKMSYGAYNREKNVLGEAKEVLVTHFVILEGVGLLRKDLMKYFDYSIWIDCPLEIATKRGIARDRDAYNVDQSKQWEEIWEPNDRDYFAKNQPDKLADAVVQL